jgi:hypothetical protein
VLKARLACPIGLPDLVPYTEARAKLRKKAESIKAAGHVFGDASK